MHTRTLMTLCLFATSAFAQGTPKPTSGNETHHPVLTHAEVPIYPRVPLTAHISGTVAIKVTVEHGAVANATVQSSDSPFLSNPAVENVKTWRLEPNASAMFVVKYVYQIKGKETPNLENPRIELELPHLVTVTARPIKPSCSDCRATEEQKKTGPSRSARPEKF